MRSRLNLPTGAAPPPLPEEPLAPAPVLSLAPDSLRMKGRFLTAWNIREGTGEEEGEIGGGGVAGSMPPARSSPNSRCSCSAASAMRRKPSVATKSVWKFVCFYCRCRFRRQRSRDRKKSE